MPAEPNFPPSLTAPLSPYPAPAKSPSLRPPALPRQHSCRSTRRWKGKASGPSREEGRWPRGSWHRGLRRLGSAAATGSRGAGRDPGAGPGRPCPHCCPRVPQGRSQGLDLHLPSGQPRGSGLSHALEPGAQPRQFPPSWEKGTPAPGRGDCPSLQQGPEGAAAPQGWHSRRQLPAARRCQEHHQHGALLSAKSSLGTQTLRSVPSASKSSRCHHSWHCCCPHLMAPCLGRAVTPWGPKATVVADCSQGLGKG